MTPPIKKCKECNTPVEATIAKDSYEVFGKVLCIECRRKVDADEPLPSEEGETVPDQSFNVEGQEDTCEVLGARDTIMKTIKDAESAPSAPPQEDEEESTFENAVSLNAPESKEFNFYDYIRNITGNDVFEVFADSGTCKTKLCLEVAKQALAKKHKVWYIDAEHNLSEEDISSLNGLKYTYEPRLNKIFEMTDPTKLPKDIDVIILDSIGYPGLAAWARLKANERGNALLQVIAIFDGLKQWALVNKSFAFVTNQPESKFAKPEGHIREPWGDKGAFATKEVFTMEYTDRKPHITTVSMKAHRSRSMGRGKKIATINVTDGGTEIKMS